MNLRFAEKLRELLTRPHYSQRWLSREAGLSLSSINRLVSGDQDPSDDNLRRVSGAFADWVQRRALIVARLQDAVDATSEGHRIKIDALGASSGDIVHLAPDLAIDLQILARRMEQESKLPHGKRTFSQMVDWMAYAIMREEAATADAASTAPLAPPAAPAETDDLEINPMQARAKEMAIAKGAALSTEEREKTLHARQKKRKSATIAAR
jgi:transcriptional regulator with XRE-family HTH domain